MASVKKAPVVLVAVVCAFVALFTYCNDTPGGNLGRRAFDEPRLTAQPKSHSEPRACGDFVPDDALEILVDHAECIDTGIRFLEQRGEPADLAAAYYIKGEYLPALTTLLRRARPDDPIALYNRALTEEKLFLNDDAIASWKALLKLDPSDTDAKQHLARLKPTATGIEAWDRNKQALRAALQRRDKAAMARLIEPFPSAAMRLFEEELMLENPAGIEVYAEVLSARLNGDRYPMDVVRAPMPKEGLEAFGRGLHPANSTEAASAYATASQLFKRAGNPLYLAADIRYAKNVDAPGDRVSLADSAAHTAQSRQYHHLAAQAYAAKAFVLYTKAYYVRALAAYDAAEKEYAGLRDSEGLVTVAAGKEAAYYDVKQYDSAFKESIKGLRYIPAATQLSRINVLVGEAARDALNLGHAEVALLYQNALIHLIQQLPEDVEHIGYNLATALRERSTIQVVLGKSTAALEDIRQAIHLYPKNDDPTKIAAVNARLSELDGQSKLQNGKLDEAIASFQRAVALTPEDKLPVLRANLIVQLAEAQARAHRPEAEQTLLEAVRVIHEEEKRQLEGRSVGEGEELWTPYFARFEDVYDRLIRILIDNGRSEDAFFHAERATAFEPLDLVLRRKDLPRGFREIARDPSVAKIQRQLPPGTVLLRFFVLDDRTYVWILTHEQFRHITIKPSRDVNKWVTDLRDAANNRDELAFTTALVAPYKELIEPALQGLNPARLVIIPDTPLHGLPFAALYDRQNRRYLVQTAPIEFAGSALLYLFSLMRDDQLAPREASALVVSDTSLTHATHEADDVAALYERSKLIHDATAAQFLTEAPGYTLLHVAAHAVPNPREPNHSYVRFAASQGDSGELRAQELLALNLKFTRLVVLSACSSAAGMPIGPEGVAPLVRPFLAAGVPAVVGTLWDVRDDTTEPLLVSFHETYGQNGDAAAALQAAQLRMLGAGQSVLAWAPFQVIGHTSPHGARRNGGTTIGNHRSDLLQRPDAVRSQ